MRHEELRDMLLVKAVEESDADGTIIPLAERAAAGREAARIHRGSDVEKLLAARAATLVEQVVTRHPFMVELLEFLAPTAWTTLALAAAGLAAGASIPFLDGPRQVNILAVPVLGVVAWNLAVYAWIAMGFRKRASTDRHGKSWITGIGSWMARRLVAGADRFNAPLAAALDTFLREWFAASRPLLLARASRALHLAAAMLGAGLVASLYVRGAVFDYRATWESTFLEAGTFRHLLTLVYGPASFLTGIALPGVAELESIRWRPGQGGGESAARWLHLAAATVLLYVVLPRVALLLLAWRRAARLSGHAEPPSWLHAHYRSAFADVEGAVPRARAIVAPYACELSAGALARLVAWVQAAAGGPVDVAARDSVAYGDEERYLEAFRREDGERADIVVLPFNLAATPESENHGIVLAGVRRGLAARPNARIIVVVDEAGYAARMAGSPERLAERREGWRSFVRAHGLEPQFVNLVP